MRPLPRARTPRSAAPAIGPSPWPLPPITAACGAGATRSCRAASSCRPNRRSADLAGVEIHVGYRSGSHYTTIQALESFLEPEQIRLRFGGLLYDRLDLLVDRKVEAATAFGAPYYVLEQLGFRKILDATFMIAAMLARDVTVADARKYFRALRRAQIDIDLMP